MQSIILAAIVSVSFPDEPSEDSCEESSSMREKIEQLGGQFMKWVSPGNDGVPDRIAILPGGDVYFIELKTDQGHSARIQEWQQQRLRRLGCNVREVRGMTEARQFIEEVVDRAIYTAQLSTESD